jgi:ankyrin repeat protein
MEAPSAETSMETSMWDEMLYKAAREADFESLEMAYDRGGRVDWKNWTDNNSIPLHVAALEGHTEVVLWLLSRKSPVNICNKYFLNTPLHYACSKAHSAIVSLLLEYGATANVADKSDVTPIHWASAQMDVDCVKWLIKNGAHVNVLNIRDETPLHFAAQNGYDANVVLLCQYGAHVDVGDKKYGYSPLHYACRAGHVSCVEHLIKFGANVGLESLEKHTPMHRAAWAGHTDIVQILIKNKANVNAVDIHGETPLHDAAMRNHFNTIEVLVHGGADKALKNYNDPPMSPFDIAKKRHFKKSLQAFHDAHVVKSGRWSGKLRLLRSKSYHSRLNWEKIMVHNIESGNIENVIKAVEKGAIVNTNIKTHFSWTPLHYAVAYGHIDIAKFLLAKGAKIDEREDEGDHILHLAVYAGHISIVRWLIETLDVDVDVTNVDKETPLHRAAQMDRLEIARYLVIHNSNIDAETENRIKISAKETRAIMMSFSKAKRRELESHFVPYDDYGTTPLHLAAKLGHKILAHRLVQWGANVNKADHHGETAL